MKDTDSRLIWEAAQVILSEGRTSVVNPETGDDLTSQHINPTVTKYIDEWVLKTFKTDNVYEIVARELFKDIELTVARYEPDEGQGLFGRSWTRMAQKEKREDEMKESELADEKEKLEKMERTLDKMKSAADGTWDDRNEIREFARQVASVESRIKSISREIRQNYKRGNKPEDYRDLPGFGGRDTGLEYLIRRNIKTNFDKIRTRLYNMWSEFRKHLEDGQFSVNLNPVMTVDNHDFDEKVYSLEDVDGRTWPSIEDKLKDLVNSNQTFDDDVKLSILSAIRR